MTKNAVAKNWIMHLWNDGTRRTFPQPTDVGPLDLIDPGQWYEAPNTLMSAVAPVSPGGSQSNVIDAWNSAAFDTVRNRLIVWGGGHSDYAGNEVYVFDINTLQWLRLTDPSTNIADDVDPYPDGRPNPRHTYGSSTYIPSIDRFWVSGGSKWQAGSCGGALVWMYDFNASPPENGWSQQVSVINGITTGDCGGCAAYDSGQDRVILLTKLSNEATAFLCAFNPQNLTSPWAILNSNTDRLAYQMGAVDTKRRKFVVVGAGATWVYDIDAAGAPRTILATTGATTIEAASAPGVEYDPIADRIVAWAGGTSIYTLNMDTLVWELSSPTNSVDPGLVTASGGTWGRFRYIPSKNCYMVVNGVNRNVFFFRLTSNHIGGYVMPDIDDEKSLYTILNWSWQPSTEPAAVTEPDPAYAVSAIDVDVRNDTEADDLWNYLMMYRRSGNAVYLNRANAWLNYFKNEYPSDVINDQAENNHLYGWGLLAWYEHTRAQGSPDNTALAVAEQLGAIARSVWGSAVPGVQAMANFGARRGGRPLLLATRLASVTRKQSWIDFRNHMIDLWLQSPDWDTRGFYEIGQSDTDTVAGVGAYAAGYRIQSSFQLSLLVDAFAFAYRSSQNTILRSRIISMASFVDSFGLDSTYQYTGAYFGLDPSSNAWHDHFASCGSACTFADPAYTTSLVNILVHGYKFTGIENYLTRARYFFQRGTKAAYGSINRIVAEDVVHHFVDTLWSSDTFYLSYNKGELQYSYLLFENGGSPLLVS